jgi:hypothetical protein
MAVVSMSKQEFSRLEVLLRVQSGRLRVSDACALIGLRRRQIFLALVQIFRRPVRANDSETQTPLEFRPYGAEG